MGLFGKLHKLAQTNYDKDKSRLVWFGTRNGTRAGCTIFINEDRTVPSATKATDTRVVNNLQGSRSSGMEASTIHTVTRVNRGELMKVFTTDCGS